MPESHVDLTDAASRLLPHAWPALLIRTVVHFTEDELVCTANFPKENALLQDGIAASHLLVEPAAQATATHLGLLATQAGAKIKGLEGYLTSAKNVEISLPGIPADTEFEIRVHPRKTIRRIRPGLFKYRFEANLDGNLVAKGELSTYVQPIAKT